MALHLYNSYTKRREVFRPLKDKRVTMYNCGPTVYDYVHIGNLRSFLFADVLRRYLKYRGYKVKQIMNITDVGHMTTDSDAGEDKMSLAAKREGKNPIEVARFYEEKFFEDMQALGVQAAWKYPRATEHISEMIKIVNKLLRRGYAYLVKEPGGASVYYDLSTFPKYGKLSGNTVRDLIPGARAEVVHEKRNPYDFALWIYKPNHVLQWDTPWGRGYPGWHLECSAMSTKYLGKTIDIHTGGEDNKFPHHECEIAQSEGATGKLFVRTWLHAKHLLVEGKKMSKSLGNFYILRDLLKRGYAPREIRYLLISTHYRETLNFTVTSLQAARSALARVDELVERLQSSPPTLAFGLRAGDKNILPERNKAKSKVIMIRAISKARLDFIRAMDDDLNVSKALAVLFKFVRKANVLLDRGISRVDSQLMIELVSEFDKVLGLNLGKIRKAPVPAAVKKLVDAREKARHAKNWARADALRNELRGLGYHVEDMPDGPRLKHL